MGLSTGRRRDLASITAAVDAARVRAEVLPSHLQQPSRVASLARPLFDVLAWNTLYTTSLHVYTPVSRNWGGDANDDAATTFVWDVFFAAVMLGLMGPGGGTGATGGAGGRGIRGGMYERPQLPLRRWRYHMHV